MSMTRRLNLIALVAALGLALSGCNKEEPLTAASLMAKAMSGSTAVELIEAAEGATFELTTEQVAQLREKGWDNDQLKTVLGKAPPPLPMSAEQFMSLVDMNQPADALTQLVADSGETVALNDEQIQMLRTKSFSDEQLMSVTGRDALPPMPPPPAPRPMTTAEPVTDGPKADADAKIPVKAPTGANVPGAEGSTVKQAKPSEGPANKTVTEGEAAPVVPKAPSGVTLSPGKKSTK